MPARVVFNLPPRDTRVILGGDRDSDNLVFLDEWKRREGLYVIGKTGTGKTSFLINLMLQDIDAGNGLCFLDPHGPATNDVLARLPDHRLHDVILLDAADTTHTFGLNFFQVDNPDDEVEKSRRAEQAVEAIRKIFAAKDYSTGWGVQIDEYLLMISHVLVANPTYTILEIPRLLTDTTFRRQLLAQVRSDYVRSFWEAYDRLPERGPDNRQIQVAPVLRRLGELLVNPLARRIVGQSESTIDLSEIMRERTIVLVKLNAGTVGNRAVNLLGSLLVGLIARAVFARDEQEARSAFCLYADEYQRFATPDFGDLFTEARKFGICTTVAHQDRSQLRRLGADVATIRAANLAVFQVNGEDALELAMQFDCTPPPPDVEGYTPILTYKQDVLAHLVANGHTDSAASHFVTQYVIPFRDDSRATYYLRTVNAVLFESMVTGKPLSLLPEELIRGCAHLLGFHHLLQRGHGAPYRDLIPELTAKLCVPLEQIPWEELVAAYAEWSIVYYDKLHQEYGSQPPYGRPRTDKEREVNRAAGRQEAENSRAKALPFLTSLRTLMAILAAQPIKDQSGQFEPRYGSRRTFADMQNEIANTLTSLPPRTARCKIQENNTAPGEFTVEVLPLSVPLQGSALEERIRSLTEQTRAQGYCRSREVVEDEIRRRHGGSEGRDEKPPDDAPPWNDD